MLARFLLPRSSSEPLRALGEASLLASVAILLTLLAAVGLGLLVAGLALRLERRNPRRAGARRALAAADED